jgi:biopolymer transport protein ExbD
MKRSLKSLPTDEVEINVSPLIDMVFILLIFFIVATSFINESGIASKYKDTANNSLSEQPPLSFQLPASGQLMQNGAVIGLEEIAPIVRNAKGKSKSLVLIQVSPGSKAGLATQVMDQAILGGAEAVKLSPIAR